MHKLAGMIILSFLALASKEASAATTYWSMVAAGCTPGDPAIQNNRYQIQSGHVAHAGTNVDVISLYCPVTALDPGEVAASGEPTQVTMTFQDESTSVGDNITAQLIRMTRTSGALTTIATLDSDSTDGMGTGVQKQAASYTHTFDFTTYVYYVRIDIDRAGTSATPVAYFVSLDRP